MIILQLFLECVLLSFIAFGGTTALLPELYRVAVNQYQWLDATTFTNLYAIAQAVPGPKVVIVTLIGWKVAGLFGALAATLGLCLPMSIIIYLFIDRWEKCSGWRWQKAVSLGIAPLAVGLIFSSAIVITQIAHFRWGAWMGVILTALVNLRYQSIHPLWLIAGGALLGLSGQL